MMIVTQQLLPLTAAALFSAAILIVAVALTQRVSAKPVSIKGRLDELGAGRKPQVRALEELELSQPFADRIIRPALARTSRILTRLAPGMNATSMQNRLNMAGNPRNMTVEVFLGLKMVLALLFAVVAFLGQVLPLGLISPQGPVLTLVWTAVAGVAGFFLPNLWLKDEARKRQKAITKVLPDTIDILSISVEAGLGFDAAITRLCTKAQNPLIVEFEKYLTEMRLGKGRRESLRLIQTRTGVEDLTAFVGAVIQADQLGVSIAKVLRLQSDQLRIKRRQRAEQLAQQAPLKMLFPMILFIFPSIFVVILGPAIKEFISAGI